MENECYFREFYEKLGSPHGKNLRIPNEYHCVWHNVVYLTRKHIPICMVHTGGWTGMGE